MSLGNLNYLMYSAHVGGRNNISHRSKCLYFDLEKQQDTFAGAMKEHPPFPLRCHVWHTENRDDVVVLMWCLVLILQTTFQDSLKANRSFSTCMLGSIIFLSPAQ